MILSRIAISESESDLAIALLSIIAISERESFGCLCRLLKVVFQSDFYQLIYINMININ